MNRLKLLAAATLLMVPIACGDPIDPPPPTGSIEGLVSIEGQGVDGVSVTLSNGGSAITANGGMYRFDNVEAGAYTVTISDYPDDASFNQTSAAAAIATDGETITVNFPGTYIRTSAIRGTVTVENEGLSGITVKLSGISNSETLTDANGMYAFSGLRAGNYTVEISGFDDEDVAFGSTSSTATLAVGESKVVSFEGTYLRTSGIMGQVTADDVPQEGITVSLQGRGENKTMTTNSAGQFAFEQLRRGDYSVGISGYNTDEMTFEVTSQSVTIAYGETANVPFEGVLLRTAGIQGTVTVDGVGPIADVTVTIQGQGESRVDVTDNVGAYSFDRLPAGDYSVVITGFNDDLYGFFHPDGSDATSATVTVELKETGTVPFDGIMLRTAAIEGTVTVGDDDAPIPATVTVVGGPKDEEHTTTTNAEGEYLVENLHAGTYSVSISGYDEVEYGFDPTSKSVTVGLRDTETVAFQGDLLRTAGVSGRVHVNGMGLAGVTVTLSGEENPDPVMTDADGQYGFSGLAAGDYTISIAITEAQAVEYAFDPTEMEFALALDESKPGVNFSGKALRTATVMGSVTVEGDALAGIAVTLIRVISATSGEILGAMATDADGDYSFGPLLAGAYQVMIAGYADEHDFADGTTQTTAVDTDGTAEVNFAATIIRTASVSGMVSVDGEAMADVEVTLTGDHAPDDNSTMTDAEGMYGFDALRKGAYTVTITNPDDEAYSFPATSQSVNLSVGQEQGGISFAGARLKQASISGQVHAGGDPIEGVTVTLSGDADAEDMTDANGEYNFPGLGGGDYMVTIANPNADAYEFASMEAAVEGLGSDEFRIVDFAGTHTKTASIGGMLFIDEVTRNLMHNEGEPALNLDDVLDEDMPGLPITLLGPELGDATPGMAGRDGMYEFPGLRAGDYVLNVDVETVIDADTDATVADLLAGLGYEYTGASLIQISVAAAEDSDDNHLPFKITMQAINVGAVMGNADTATATMVGGVELALYATTEANAPMLGTGTTDSTGVATFHFARAMDLGPGGIGNDHLVFAKVTSTGHDDLVVSDNADIEIQYAATARVSSAPAAARLQNNRANFQWWIKSDKDARHGDEFLAGWKVVLGTDTIATGAGGKGSYSGMVELGDKAATMTVMADTTQADSLTMGEKWMQSDALKYTHDPLVLPAMNTAEMNDLGPIYVTYTTQRLVVGVYREADDEDGYSDYRSALPRGDHRPHATTAAGMKIELLKRDANNRLRRHTWDPDPKTGKNRKEGYASPGSNGLVTFTGIPAGDELTIRFHLNGGNARKKVDHGYDDIETFGDDLESGVGVTVGAFGEMSGGQSEVRMCSASDPDNADATTDDWCATFGYVWMTGRLSGTVGGQKGHKVAIDPATGHGATDDSTRTGTGGAYAFTGVQDGEYSATASDNGNYTVDGPATAKGIALYHDEFADNEGEDKADSAWAGRRAQATHSWQVTKGGLSIMGFVANDNGDNLIRGDEAVAGIEVKLLTNVTFHPSTAGDNAGKLKSSKTAQTTETAGNGLYSFTGLDDKTKYWVQVPAGGYINLNAKNPSLHGGTGGLAADVYPALPDEILYAKPVWGTTSLTSGETVLYTVGTGTAAQSATLYNFGLVYSDGTVAGTVNNMGGSSANIDVRITSNLNDDEAERATDAEGDFRLSNLMEGTYTAVIEDAGWASPLMDDAGKPDDDADCEDPANPGTTGAEFCDNAPSTISGALSGRNDYADMGTLYVYSSTASDVDSVATANIRVKVRMQGSDDATYNDTTSWDPAWTRGTDTEETENTSSLGTISFASASVEISIPAAARPAGVSIAATVDTVGGSKPKSCAGLTCTLAARKTPATGTIGAVLENAITVTVTAANGYDDHAYSFVAARANPENNALGTDRVRRHNADNTYTDAGGTGTFADPYTLATASASAASLNLHVNLKNHGVLDDNARCAQSLIVKNSAGEEVASSDDDDDDICTAERYTLTVAAGGSRYTLHVSSEDGVEAVHRLALSRGT